VGVPGDDYHAVGAGADQWLVEPDGSILMPVYCQDQADEPSYAGYSMVWRCTFDGKTLRRVAEGNKLIKEVPEGYGEMSEPSITRFRGRYYLTLRGNVGHVSTSTDGLNFEKPKPWMFDDGDPVGSYRTQQHWITHSDALFLVYTRWGNASVFRHRAPLYMAQVDPDRLVLLRDTEQVLLPDRGVPMGNFGAANVTDSETWVTVGENMFFYGGRDPRYRGAEGAILLARIAWSKPNANAPLSGLRKVDMRTTGAE
jgi:hypothetical protein